MLVEAYTAALPLCLTYGKLFFWLVVSFITSIPVFMAVVLTSLYFRKNKKKFNWLVRLALIEAYLLIAWIALLFSGGVGLKGFSVPLIYGIGSFLFLATPLSWAYNKLLDRYPMLPWHFTQYLLCLLGSLVFWAAMVFWFGLFSAAPLWSS